MKLPKIKYEILYNEDGEKTGVLLPHKDYENLIDMLEDLYDLKEIYRTGCADQKTFTFEEVKAGLAVRHARK